MSKQSKTLLQFDEIPAAVLEAAAVEIRRLHAQRDALLEALRKCSEQLTRLGYSANHADQAIAAIKKAEEA